jgi:fructose-bisphosphate aldolase class II/tagatose 1,6-diphosphate aldolase GatY/KbaY
MTLKEKLKELQKNNSALWATNFYNLETLQGILSAVVKDGKPVILQLTRSSIEYMGLKTAVAMARTAMGEFGVDAWIHLDHGDSVDLVARCLDEGFDSVMIDASEQSLELNIETSRKVVEMAEKYGANVEAELGYVAKLGQSTDKVGFTEPKDAQRFVKETGVDALAVAIGSAHGFYKETPKLDIERLKEISSVVDIPLVLHGGSGIPAEQIKKAVNAGICKINVATEIKNAFMTSLKTQLRETDEIDLRKVFPQSVDKVTELLINKFTITK